MRPTSAEAEWAVRAMAFDRIGVAVGGLAIEATHARRGDPPNIRRLRVSGPRIALVELERAMGSIASGLAPPLGIFARMSLAVMAKAASRRVVAPTPRRKAQ